MYELFDYPWPCVDNKYMVFKDPFQNKCHKYSCNTFDNNAHLTLFLVRLSSEF